MIIQARKNTEQQQPSNKPIEITFQDAAAKIDTYFRTLGVQTDLTRAYGFIDGLLCAHAINDADNARLYAYAGQIYIQKTKDI